jgi:hypothetical protein
MTATRPAATPTSAPPVPRLGTRPQAPELSDYAKHVVEVLDGCDTHDAIKDVVDQLIRELRVHYEGHLGTAKQAYKYRNWIPALGGVAVRRYTDTQETHAGLKAMTEGVRAAYDYLDREAKVQAKLATREGHEDKVAQQEWGLLKSQKVRLGVVLDAVKKVDVDMDTGDYAKIRDLALDKQPEGSKKSLWDPWEAKPVQPA